MCENILKRRNPQKKNKQIELKKLNEPTEKQNITK